MNKINLRNINNLGRKIYSVVLAVIIWIIIYNIYDPIITVKVEGIRVSIINDELITSMNKVYSIDKDEEIIEIYLTGKQSIVKNITSTDIAATANLENLSITNAVAIDINIPKLKNEEVEINYEKNDTIHLILDNYVTIPYDLQIVKEGNIPINTYLHTDNCDAKINISGPQEQLKMIETLYIQVPLGNLKENYKKEFKIYAIDKFGENIDLSNFKLSQETFIYSPTVYKIKEIPIQINCKGNPQFGYSLKNVSLTNDKLKIAASSEILSKYESLNLSYDINGINSSTSIVFNLEDYLQDDIIILSNEKSTTLNVEIDKLSIREFEFTNKDLTIRNLLEGYSYKYLNNEKLKITIMGQESYLKNLKIEDISPYIDLNNQIDGIYSLEIEIPHAIDLTILSNSTIGIEVYKMKQEIMESSISTSEETISEENNNDVELDNENLNEETINENVDENQNSNIEEGEKISSLNKTICT